VHIERAIGDRQNDMPHGARRRGRNQLVSQLVRIHTRLAAPILERVERGDEESRLAHEALGAAIVRRAWLEQAERQPLERIHVLLVQPQRVVEPEHLGDESRAEAKGRFRAAFARSARGNTEQHFAFGVGERPSRSRQTLGEAIDDLAGRDHVRQQERTVLGEDAILDRAQQVRRGRARRHDNEPVARIERCAAACKGDHGLTERLQVGHPHQACRARRDHCSLGGSRSSRSCCWARASIISAPAAADDASHAVLMSAETMAS
jgi:hypothetical protein